MAFTKYFAWLVKQEGPFEKSEVMVPLGEGLIIDSDGQLKPEVISSNLVTEVVTENKIGPGAVTAVKIAAGAAKPSKIKNTQAVTATDTGSGTGTIDDDTSHAIVTSAASSKIVVLPTPTPGRPPLVIDVGANGFELASSAPATVAINGGAGSSFSSAIAANSTLIMICVSATAWKGFFLDADSDVAKVEAAN